MLDPEKDTTVRNIYSKNMLRIVAALFIWATVYKIFILAVFQDFNLQAVIQILKEVLLFKHESHLYYLHIIIIVYVFLPITRIVTRHASKRELQYILGVWFVLGIVYPLAKHFWPFTLVNGIPNQWLMNMTYASIGYGIMGYYLQKYAKRSKLFYAVLSGIGVTAVFTGTWVGSVNIGSLYQVFFEGMSPFVAFMAIGIFGLVRCFIYSDAISTSSGDSIRLSNNASEVAFSEIAAADDKTIKKGSSTIPIISKHIFTLLSKASFCIYLVHKIFIYIFNINGLKVSILPAFASIPILVLANLSCSMVAYFVLSRIPIVRKYII